MFGCCNTCPTEKLSSHRKKMADEGDWATAKALSHYRVSDTGSFIDFQRTNSTHQGTPNPSILSNGGISQSIRGALEEFFLLGNATEKVICKVEKVHLRSITHNSGDFSVCGINSCIKSAKYEKVQLNSKKKNFPAQEKGSKTPFSLYANSTSEVVAEYIGESFQSALVVDANCGCGGYAIKVIFAKMMYVKANLCHLTSLRGILTQL